MALIAVVDQIDAWIHALVPDLGISRHVRMPLNRIVADKVVGSARQRLLPNHTRLAGCAGQSHTHDVDLRWLYSRPMRHTPGTSVFGNIRLCEGENGCRIR